MNLKYETLQKCEGFDIVAFDKSFSTDLKKSFEKEAKKYQKMLKKSKKSKNMYTVIPPSYNPEIMHTALTAQNLIEDEAIGIIMNSDQDAVFSKISSEIANSQDYCTVHINSKNLIICPDDVAAVQNLKNIIEEKFVEEEIAEVLSNRMYDIKLLSEQETAYIKDKMLEDIIDVGQLDEELLIEASIFIQSPLCRIAINRRKSEEIQRLLELLNISFYINLDTIYAIASEKEKLEEYIPKMLRGEIRLSDKVYMYDQDMQQIEIKPKEKVTKIFNHKNIEEIIKSKTDVKIPKQYTETIVR